jgi:hypothetical protein
MMERLSDAVLDLWVKFVSSNPRVKHLSEFLHEEEKREKRKRKVIEELRMSGPCETLLMSPSKIQKTRGITSSRKLGKEQLRHEKKIRAQVGAQEKA